MADARVVRVVELIQEEWRAPLRIPDLARHVGLGVSTLEHLFRRDTRYSIRDFIRDRRLTAAATLLLTTDERVSIISYQVGFLDVANFNHAFKKRFGISPSQYRLCGADCTKAETTK